MMNPTRNYETTLGFEVGITALSHGGGLHRIDFPRPIEDKKEVRSAILDAWGCGPYTVTSVDVFGSCAIFYSRVDYTN
jgi:hypothetical protein